MFYTIGIASFYYLGMYHIKDTNYDHIEEGAVVPNHILEGQGLTPGQQSEDILRRAHAERKVADTISEKAGSTREKV